MNFKIHDIHQIISCTFLKCFHRSKIWLFTVESVLSWNLNDIHALLHINRNKHLSFNWLSSYKTLPSLLYPKGYNGLTMSKSLWAKEWLHNLPCVCSDHEERFRHAALIIHGLPVQEAGSFMVQAPFRQVAAASPTSLYPGLHSNLMALSPSRMIFILRINGYQGHLATTVYENIVFTTNIINN